MNKIQRGGEETRRRPQAEEGPLTVLFEDEAVLVLDKPAGLVVHPTYRNTTGTLLNAVLWRYRTQTGIQPGILTRLDKDTSGVVVIALTPEVHASLQRDMGAGRVKKEYIAVVTGAPHPACGRISLPLGRSPLDRRLVVVREDGARCETEYEVLNAGAGDARCGTDRIHSPSGAISVVRCEPLTGRTHQIRVHLASSGWPIVGDRVYGEASETITRQALHAWRVTFPHPITGESVCVTSPLPADIEALAGSGFSPVGNRSA